MSGSENLSVFVGPLIAIAVLGGLAMILRWAFLMEQRPYRTRRYSGRHGPGWAGSQPPWPSARRDYGLLEDVAVVDGPAAADALRDALSAVNIRTTVVIEADGKVRVMVFNDELDQARQVLGS